MDQAVVGKKNKTSPNNHRKKGWRHGSSGVVGNNEGNKITETIFTGSSDFITVTDSGEIISQSLEP
jgi:hypothetical protein